MLRLGHRTWRLAANDVIGCGWVGHRHIVMKSFARAEEDDCWSEMPLRYSKALGLPSPLAR
jgi:hypothetical protein